MALLKEGEVVHAEGFGALDVERNLPVTPRTLYGIGSCTKSFTALAVMKLVGEGRHRMAGWTYTWRGGGSTESISDLSPFSQIDGAAKGYEAYPQYSSLISLHLKQVTRWSFTSPADCM
jgi:hypothetical protein